MTPSEAAGLIPEDVLTLIAEWVYRKKHGYLQLNFHAGNIPNINVHESVKLGSGLK